MNVTPASRWLHRFAWGTAVLTLLLPVATGAVVTTLQAGMAFPDWPSSDGYNMLAYPWLRSARDQFVEHGHRLAGLTIGLLSISLAVFAWMVDSRRQVRVLAAAIFGSVFIQGMLGGARVLMDERVLALIHGDFAAAVFSLMSVFVLVTGQSWDARERIADKKVGRTVSLAATMLLMSLMVQYYLGGVLRHFGDGWAWIAHPWFALVPVMLAPVFAIVARRSGSPLLVRCSVFLLGLIVSQAVLGLVTWYVSRGVPAWGVVARRGSTEMVLICSLHKVAGMLTLMTSVISVVCSASVQRLTCERSPNSMDLDRTLVGVAI